MENKNKAIHDKTEIFERLPVPRAVAKLAIPTVLSMIVSILYNLADTYFVGQTGDPNQVAAVSLTMPVFLLMMACGNIFGVGGSTYISRSMGEGNFDRMKRISAFSFWGAAMAGVAVMFVLFGCMDGLLQIIGSSENTIGFARDYLTYLAMGGVPVVLSNALANLVRGEGGAKVAMIGMILGTVTNIVLDPVMILYMDMGVVGAAIATVIGNITSCVYYILFLLGKKTQLSIHPKHFQVKNIASSVLVIGVPASVNNVLMSVSHILMNNFLAGYGDAPVAAMGVAMKANMMVVFLQMGIAMGVQPLIGYCYGAHKVERLKKTVHFSVICNIILGTTLTVIYLLFTENIVRAFIDDQTVIGYGVEMLRALMLSGPVLGVMFVFTFAFQGMGKAVPSLILSISRQGMVFVPVLLIANAVFGLSGIIFAQPIADIACLILALLMFVSVTRKMARQDALREAAGQ